MLSCRVQSSLVLPGLLCIPFASYMDYLTQHFIAWARKEIQALVERLNGIDKVLQRQPESKDKTDAADDKHQQSPTILRAELKISHSEKYQDEAKAARDLIRETWKLYVEIFTLLVVFGYTTVAAFQLSEMKKATVAAEQTATAAQRANSDARDRFRDDQRPYIWVTNTGIGTPEFHPNPDTNPPIGQVLWTIHYTNFGKAPAYGTINHKFIRIGENSKYRKSYRANLPPPQGSGAPTPPGKDDFITVVSAPGISRDEFDRLMKISRSFSAKFIIEYTDAYGGKYETAICLHNLGTGSIQYCDGSYIH